MTMSGSQKTVLAEETEEASEEREVSLRDGRRLTVSESGVDQLVEIRNESGMLELRIKLTPEGPILQMEAVRMELKASEALQIASPKVEIRGSEKLELSGGKVALHGEEEIEVEAAGDVRVVGKTIHLN
jgi:hypothetical protein